MKPAVSIFGVAALSLLAGAASAESESSSYTSESASSTRESSSSSHESVSTTWAGGSDANALSEQQCLTEVLARVNTADVTVLSSRRIKDGVWVRVGVGPDQTPWHCVSRDDGSTTDVGPARQSAHGGHQGHHGAHHHGQAHGHGGDNPFFDSPGLYEQACLMDVENKAGTLTAAVLGSEQTESGLRVRIGVGQSRAPWHCLAQEDGTTSDVGPVRQHGGQN